jgi:glycosyltransferase involved in cell wall biosynthesis
LPFAREIIEKNDIKVISAYNLFAFAPIGAVLSEEYNIPLVVTNFGEIYQDLNFAKKNIVLVRYICETAEKLLAMSNHCAESYKLLGLLPHVDVIPYGVDIEKFSSANDEVKIRKQFGISSEEPVILYVGRLKKDMGLHILLEAIPSVCKNNKEINFLIVGEKGELLSRAEQLSNRYSENVFLVPRVPFGDLPIYYAASTIVVVPTQGDRACGSLASIEAMACGKPVIASDVGGIPEIVIDSETGFLIPPENSDALANKILEVINNAELLKRMGIAGRKRVEELFDEIKTDEKIEQIFEKLLENR